MEKDTTTPAEEKRRLLTEIVDLGQRANAGGVPREDWENHELNWTAYCSNLRKNLVRALARALIEQERSDAPMSTEMHQVLYWWQHEGGREKYLSELPIEERRALERIQL